MKLQTVRWRYRIYNPYIHPNKMSHSILNNIKYFERIWIQWNEPEKLKNTHGCLLFVHKTSIVDTFEMFPHLMMINRKIINAEQHQTFFMIKICKNGKVNKLMAMSKICAAVQSDTRVRASSHMMNWVSHWPESISAHSVPSVCLMKWLCRTNKGVL